MSYSIFEGEIFAYLRVILGDFAGLTYLRTSRGPVTSAKRSLRFARVGVDEWWMAVC
jgi:hypothetical protein